ncbi:MAG: DUF1499 domain-containing protein [Betaproteobacteria bacterium]|nr:DUF1499 domain-containing protein [Betaproteobacteria bacterium]
MNAQQSPGPARLGNRLVVIGLLVALASAAAMVFSGIGYRLDLYHFRIGFTILRWAFWFALAGAVLSVAGLVITGGRPRRTLVAAFIGAAVGVMAAYIPWTWKQTADALPYIHDISTDTASPPEFVAAAKLRKPGDHPVTYDGKEVADLQQKAYPDVVTLTTKTPGEKVFEAAKTVIASMGMQLVDADPAQGRIEANQTSLFYGFTDDMVVRITTGTDGTKVDVRSKSRVGRSDLGQNAKRIRAFLQRLKTNLG